jgi:hypothetical protein
MLRNDTPLSLTILTRADVSRSLRELQEFEGKVYQAGLRNEAAPLAAHVSAALRESAESLNISLENATDRQRLAEELQSIHRSAPQVHVSFAMQPPLQAVEAVTGWFRRNTHPAVLVQVGVDPSIIAGCVIRTTNKVFNFSFAGALRDSTPVLQEGIASL